MLSNAANIAQRVDFVFALVVGICLFFFVLVTALLVVFVIRFRRSKNPEARNIRGNTALEITWTVVPTLLVLVIFYYGWVSYGFMRRAPADAMKINVTGRMWSWLFEYENGVKSDTLYVPLGRPVELRLRSQDVIHSLFIPAFRVKQDVVPGATNSVWFTAQEEGTYDILCAEYCGLQHAYMLSAVKVLPEAEFDRWYAQRSASAAGPDTTSSEVSAVRRGAELVRLRGCISCHSTDGSARVGPSFLGAFGAQRTVRAGGELRRVRVDSAYLHRSIVEPGAEVVQGYQPVMHPSGEVFTEQEIRDVIAYIRSLGSER